jgi:hypothetical protein
MTLDKLALEKTICLNPTHQANTNILNKLREQQSPNYQILKNKIKVIAMMFTKGKSINEMLNGLRGVKYIVIDEFFQLSEFSIYLLYLASLKYGCELIVSGDINQIPSPDDSTAYDLRNNDFINKIMFKHIIKLEYNFKSCRFTDDLPVYLEEIKERGTINQYFENKVVNPNNLDFDFSLC